MATVKGLTVAIGADTKQFNKELRAADRSIKATSKEVEALTESLNIEFDAGRFEEAMRLAENVIEQTEEKAKALRSQLDYLEKTGGTDTEGYQKLQTELIKTESKAVLLKKKLQEIKDLKIEKLANQFKTVGDGITKAGQAIAPFSAAAAGMLASFTAISFSAINSADELKTFADRVNLSAEELQKWQYIAMQTDVTNDELQAGLVKAQGAFGSLAKGDIDVASQALLDLGISAEQASQGMGANFDALVNKLAGIQDPILQAAYANEIFGERMGAKLVPMLKAGGEGLADLAREFENFDTLTNDQIDNLAEFDNVMNKIKYSFKVMKDQLGVALLPIMQTLADLMITKVIPAVQRLTDWFTNLSEHTKQTIMVVLAAIAALGPILLIVGKLTSGIGGVIKGVGLLSKALTFLSLHPIIAIIALVIGLLVTLYSTNEQFRNSVNNLISQLGDALMPILNTLMTALGAIFEALMPIINILGNVLGTVITALTPIITFLVNLLAKTLIPIIELVANVFVKAFGFVQKVIEGYVKIIEKIINGIIDFINILIKQINKLGDVLGFTVGELNRVDMSGKILSTETKQSQFNAESTPEKVISNAQVTDVPKTVINNDYSDKDIQINVTVQNYAKEVDTDKLIRDINIKLAEAM